MTKIVSFDLKQIIANNSQMNDSKLKANLFSNESSIEPEFQFLHDSGQKGIQDPFEFQDVGSDGDGSDEIGAGDEDIISLDSDSSAR